MFASHRLQLIAGCVLACVSSATATVEVNGSGSLLSQAAIVSARAAAPGAVTLEDFYSREVQCDYRPFIAPSFHVPMEQYWADAPVRSVESFEPGTAMQTSSFNEPHWYNDKERTVAFAQEITPVPEPSTIVPAALACVALLTWHVARATRTIQIASRLRSTAR